MPSTDSGEEIPVSHRILGVHRNAWLKALAGLGLNLLLVLGLAWMRDAHDVEAVPSGSVVTFQAPAVR